MHRFVLKFFNQHSLSFTQGVLLSNGLLPFRNIQFMFHLQIFNPFVLLPNRTFNCTSLEESESDERSTMCITLGRTEGGARQFREDGDILKMKGEYCVPAVSNFPAFDAAYYPYLFQMTIRKEHPIKGMCGALQKVSAFSKVTSDAFENGVKDCVLVFVVPSNIANKWKKKQPFSKEGDKPFKKLVRQFVLGLDERNCRSTDRRGLD